MLPRRWGHRHPVPGRREGRGGSRPGEEPGIIQSDQVQENAIGRGPPSPAPKHRPGEMLTQAHEGRVRGCSLSVRVVAGSSRLPGKVEGKRGGCPPRSRMQPEKQGRHCALSNMSIWSKHNYLWDFPGGPAVKTPRSQCRGPGFNPWSGN